jgi:DNA-nicking Smr family endonuclease
VKKPEAPRPSRKTSKTPAGVQGDDDAALWRHAASTIEPLAKGRAKGRFHPAADSVKAAAPSANTAASQKKPAAGREKERSSPAIVAVPPAKAAPPRMPELALFDRNNARKIRAGRLQIEARVDLHGMRQHEAHAALRRFLLSCQSRGFRYVLIITGKGKRSGLDADHIGEGLSERGILKRNVPRWLDEPDLRAVVVSFTVAAIQHGGEGAIYVHLRSRTRE